MGKPRYRKTAERKKGGGTVIREVRETYIPPSPKAKKKGICWVATAYYGDAYHPKVNQLRDYRESLLTENSIKGVAMTWLNNFYLFIGRSSFGEWWAKGLSTGGLIGFRKTISYFLLKPLLFLSKK